jgi:hypothetical protein
MIEQLIPLIGKQIESDEIKKLFEEWGVPFPKKTTCTANNDSLGDCKMKKDGLSLLFGRGGHAKLLKPVPLDKKGVRFAGIFCGISANEKYKGEFPLGIKISMNDEVISTILGKPVDDNFMNIFSRTWRKEFREGFEVLFITNIIEGKTTKEMRVYPTWNNDLYTMEDYEKAGL